MMHLSHTFADLGDPFSSAVTPRPLSQPQLVAFDPNTAKLLELAQTDHLNPQLLNYLSGNSENYTPKPIAMVYAGHQFGGYSPQLGDGRGVLLGERQTQKGLMDIHLKGAGKTPYSRFGDGHAVLRSCIREHLASIAMRGLGINTSHSLCIIKGDNPVRREEVEPAAMLTRVAKTHIRFGSFEYFFHTHQHQYLNQLADYVIARHYPSLANHKTPYDALFQTITDSTASLIAKWQAVGFCHGVMNTDNMSILGETLDYGPFGFMERFDPNHICNSSDHQGRYAFKNQPDIGLWNLHTLAYAMSPLLDNQLTKIAMSSYEQTLNQTYASAILKKVGLHEQTNGVQKCVEQLFKHMHDDQCDYTLVFNALTDFALSIIDNNTIMPTPVEAIRRASHTPIDETKWQSWLDNYRSLLEVDANIENRVNGMKKANPIYILRNFYAQQAIDAAYQYHDYGPLNDLSDALSQPFTYKEKYQRFSQLTPQHAQGISVSCSS